MRLMAASLVSAALTFGALSPAGATDVRLFGFVAVDPCLFSPCATITADEVANVDLFQSGTLRLEDWCFSLGDRL